MGMFSNKIDRKQLKPGDHIYSWRQGYLYAHHGIYVGEEKVIHFTRATDGTETLLDRLVASSIPNFNTEIPCPKCGDGGQTRTNGVTLSCLDCFLSRGELCLFEYAVSCAHFLAQARGGTCTIASSDATEDVLHRAFYLLENGFGPYNVFKNNCEDFAIYCKTGLVVTTTISLGGSGQAGSCSAAASSIASLSVRFVTTSFCGMTLVGCGTYCITRLVSDIWFRHKMIAKFKEAMMSRFGMTNLGLMSFGIAIEVVRQNDGIFTSQKKYASDILKKFNMGHSKPISHIERKVEAGNRK
ncbi:protein LEAD-SENSITIVE 1-like [Trifolium pratense]|uniref:protein LEAD-SENSITIVE 1-like n=1 Tax=Trifolium pratense TaxID=57577 RepID=UPI001E6930FC|nr:protein LEAD-SENSITIVE 1-like [Trifolium pratense]